MAGDDISSCTTPAAMQADKAPIDFRGNIDASPSGNNVMSLKQDPVIRGPAWLSLPPEVWQNIVRFLLPSPRPEHQVFPHPDCRLLEDTSTFKTTHHEDLLNLALACKRLTAVALRALYSAPFLRTGTVLNHFVETICRNDQGMVLPKTCEAAASIRALHIDSTTTDCELRHPKKRFCLCDLHILFSYADRVRYLSFDFIDNEDCGLGYSFWDSENHPIFHFLSRETTCRPERQRWRFIGERASISLSNATSLAPLSLLTHLELVNIELQPDLIAFLTGDLTLARNFPKIQDAISEGLSPKSKLECLRFDCLPDGALHHFGYYITRRMAYDARDPMYSERTRDEAELGHPRNTEDAASVQEFLYNLAINASNLPSMRLLILDVSPTYAIRPSHPQERLEKLVEQGILQEVSRDYAVMELSSLFDASFQTSGKRRSSLAHGLDVTLKEMDTDWRNRLADRDEYWRLVDEGKRSLMALFNTSRSKKGLGEVEIRTVVSRDVVRRWQEPSSQEMHTRRNFYYQAENVAPASRSADQGFSSQSVSNKSSTNDVGAWNDPDVFSLVRSMPWLSYEQFSKVGCLCWTGELPRDSHPNATAPTDEPNMERTIIPVIIKLDPAVLDKPEGAELKRKKSPDGEAAESKRQRSDTAARDQAGPSRA